MTMQAASQQRLSCFEPSAAAGPRSSDSTYDRDHITSDNAIAPASEGAAELLEREMTSSSNRLKRARANTLSSASLRASAPQTNVRNSIHTTTVSGGGVKKPGRKRQRLSLALPTRAKNAVSWVTNNLTQAATATMSLVRSRPTRARSTDGYGADQSGRRLHNDDTDGWTLVRTVSNPFDLESAAPPPALQQQQQRSNGRGDAGGVFVENIPQSNRMSVTILNSLAATSGLPAYHETTVDPPANQVRRRSRTFGTPEKAANDIVRRKNSLPSATSKAGDRSSTWAENRLDNVSARLSEVSLNPTRSPDI